MRTAILVLLLATLAVSFVDCATRRKTFHAEPCTGINSRRNQPIFSFPMNPAWAPFANQPAQSRWQTVNGHRTLWKDQLGVHNSTPGAIDAIPFALDTPLDSVIATNIVDGYFGAFTGPNFAIARQLNVKINNMAAMINQFGDNLTNSGIQKRPSILASEPLTDADAPIGEDVTLGRWLSGSGRLSVECKHDNQGVFQSASFKLTVENLLPHRLYISEFVFEQANGFSPSPLGGVNAGGTPGTFLTDDRGSFEDERPLNFCPLDDVVYGPTTQDNNKSFSRRLIALTIVNRSNMMDYGHMIVWSRAGAQTLHDALIFAIPESSEKIIEDEFN
jgi:hypothetical protein